MKSSSILIAAFCAALVGCASAPAAKPAPAVPAEEAATPASALVDRAGDSTDTAVEVPADAPNGGVDFENEWIFGRIGRFRREGGGTGQQAGRRYDIVEVATPLGGHFKFFFDITENWKRWKPPTP